MAQKVRGRAVRFIAVAAVVALAASVAAMGVSSAATPSKAMAAAAPKQGGEITYGLEAETAGGWCPPTARLAASGIMVVAAVYDTLMAPNTKGKMVPYLAKSVTHDPTYKTWTITLREGIEFHDGTPLTADAVKQNMDLWKTGVLLSATFGNLDTITSDGNLTVTVTTKVPWVAFENFLYFDGRLGIVAPAQLANMETCPSNLIGTGPFKKVSWDVNQSLVVERNPDYWQEDKNGVQLPYLDKITFRPVAEAIQRTNSLEGGQLDVIHTADGQQYFALTQEADKFDLLKEKNGRREIRYYLLNVAKPPFDDPDARRAVALAINREEINQIRNNGAYEVGDGPFDTSVPGYTKNNGYPKFNLAQAKKLAQKYKDAHGGEFSVILEHTNDPANSQEAQLLKEQLAKAGIDATLVQDDQTAFIVKAISGNFSIMLWRNHPGDPPDGQYQWWNTGSTINFGKIADPELQSLIDEGRSEPDAAKRKTIYQNVDKLFAKQLYNIWAYNVNWLVAAQKDVQGLAGPPLPDGGGQPLFLFGRHPLLGIYLTK
jgi:peptide/nickel transport system substrate-binding protein